MPRFGLLAVGVPDSPMHMTAALATTAAKGRANPSTPANTAAPTLGARRRQPLPHRPLAWWRPRAGWRQGKPPARRPAAAGSGPRATHCSPDSICRERPGQGRWAAPSAGRSGPRTTSRHPHTPPTRRRRRAGTGEHVRTRRQGAREATKGSGGGRFVAEGRYKSWPAVSPVAAVVTVAGVDVGGTGEWRRPVVSARRERGRAPAAGPRPRRTGAPPRRSGHDAGHDRPPRPRLATR